MCGGFHCSKISLQLLNIIYLLVAVLLIGIAAYAKASAVITSFEIAGGYLKYLHEYDYEDANRFS